MVVILLNFVIISAAVMVHGSDTESTVDDPHWVPFDPDTDALLADAIVGGYENETLYISRASYKEAVTPGTFVPSQHSVIIGWNGLTHVKRATEILCGRNHQWVSTTTDNIPDGAVVGGHSELGNETLYICRGNCTCHLIVGKVHKSHKSCYLPCRDQETGIKHFEILVAYKNKPTVQSLTTTPRVQSTVTTPEDQYVSTTQEAQSTTTTPEEQHVSTTQQEQSTTTTPEEQHVSTTQSTTSIPRVQTSQCLIPRKLNTDYVMPHISIPCSAKTWPTRMSNSTADYMQVESGQMIIFSCDNSGGETGFFQKFPERNEISASCVEQDKFIVEDKSYKMSELLCAKAVIVVAKERRNCLTETSELFHVGYKLHRFSKTYEVCFDTTHNIPLYTHAMISKSNYFGDETYEWQYPVLDAHRDTYTCNNATSTCCYSRAQLLNARDVSAGPSQRTTFVEPLNVVPQWHPCDMTQSPWDNIEDAVRSLLDTYGHIDVWSGTYMMQEHNGTVTPRFLWKVLRFDDTKSIAVVYVNGPSPSEADILCKNTCGDDGAVPRFYDYYDEHIYCCNVDEFLHAFGLGGSVVGKSSQTSLDTILRKKFSTSNLLLRKLTERTPNVEMTQQFYFVNSIAENSRI